MERHSSDYCATGQADRLQIRLLSPVWLKTPTYFVMKMLSSFGSPFISYLFPWKAAWQFLGRIQQCHLPSFSIEFYPWIEYIDVYSSIHDNWPHLFLILVTLFFLDCIAHTLSLIIWEIFFHGCVLVCCPSNHLGLDFTRDMIHEES